MPKKYLSIDKINEVIKLENKWVKYKRLRNYEKKCKVGHPDFLTIMQRENILDKLFFIIFDDKEE